MHRVLLAIAILAAAFSVGVRPEGRAQTAAVTAPSRDPKILQAAVDAAVAGTLEKFAARKLQSNQLAVTLLDLRDPAHPTRAAYRGDVAIYPASVVKLFYLAAAHRWMEDARLQDTPELRRALRDMIVVSYNEATHYVVDVLTGTTSGPELPDAEIDRWFDQRNAVNRYFTSLGYTNINANKKPWCEGPYGRESQSIKRHQPSRNLLTTDATARLLAEIATGQCVTAARCTQMMELLKRTPKALVTMTDESEEGQDFTSPGLPPGTKLWSKAGWTSQTRHDAAYLELPDGGRFVLVVFTTDHANEREIIPTMTRNLLARLARPVP